MQMGEDQWVVGLWVACEFWILCILAFWKGIGTGPGHLERGIWAQMGVLGFCLGSIK